MQVPDSTPLADPNAVVEIIGRRPRILVVDDDEDLRLWLKRKLRKIGFEVSVCSNGADALLHFFAERYDVLLVDVVMPGMSGHEFIRSIRGARLNDWVPILLLSSKASKQDILSGIVAGADDYLTKPLSTEVLEAKLLSALRHLARFEASKKIGVVSLSSLKG